MYAAISLEFHTMPPATLDFDAAYQRDFERYNTLAFVPGDHLWASFTHLNGYSSNYYTYVLDKVIALDFFAQFDSHDLLGGPAGMRYRRTVLAPGATRPAAQLVNAASSAVSRTWMPTAAGCWRSSRAAQTPPRPLGPLQPLAETLEELGERRVLLHLDVQVTHAGVVESLAVAVVDRQLAGAEDLERLLERVRSATIAGTDLTAAAGASLAPLPRRRVSGARAVAGCAAALARHRDDRHRRGCALSSISLNSSCSVRASVGAASVAAISWSVARAFSCGLTGTTATEANSERT